VESEDKLPSRTDRTGGGVGQTGDPVMPPGFLLRFLWVCDDKSTSTPALEDDEELVDYRSSLEHMNFDINVVHMSMNGYLFSKEDITHLNFGPKEAIF
jgi:hypothetical protein